MLSPPLSCSPFDSGREAEAHLTAESAGGRTVLRRQHVGYPLHITRGFHLDRSRPDLLTLYLQSVSGGLYAGDRLKLDVTVGPDAALHLTTQASTIVRGGQHGGSALQLRVSVDQHAFCAITNDPYILFPGADLSLDTVAVVPESAVLLMADGFAVHDPKQAGRHFSQFFSRQRILRPDGRLLVLDCGRIRGDQLRSAPLGSMSAAATVILVAPSGKRPDIGAWAEAADRCGCLAGASEAPNQAGLVLRILAPDGGALARGVEAAFHVAGRAALGAELARRRK